MTLSPEELVSELQRSVKTLLGLGARMPKELMLFVKNMMFLDGAITPGPRPRSLRRGRSDRATTHGQARRADHVPARTRTSGRLGTDMAGVKAGFGLDESTPSLTHRELQARRAQVREKFSGPNRDPRP